MIAIATSNSINVKPVRRSLIGEFLSPDCSRPADRMYNNMEKTVRKTTAATAVPALAAPQYKACMGKGLLLDSPRNAHSNPLPDQNLRHSDRFGKRNPPRSRRAGPIGATAG
jgi:hypothetical protein